MQNLGVSAIAGTFKAKSNFFKVQTNKIYYKYKCSIDPINTQDDQSFIFFRLIKQREISRQLRECYGHHMALNFIIYCEEYDKPKKDFIGKIDEQEYKLTVEFAGEMPKDNFGEQFSFYGRVLKEMQRQLRMIRIQGKYFFRNIIAELPNNYLKIYSGYQSSLRTFGENRNIFASIDPVYKICNTKTLSEFIRNFMIQQSQERLIEHLQGQIVMTNYPPIKMFRIDGIAFDLNPESSFKRNNEDITFVDYYKRFHNLNIQYLDQPLILNKDRRTGKEIYLLPEFLQLTGLDEKTRSNFHVTKEIDKYTKPNPSQRYIKTQELIKAINSCESTQQQDTSQKTYDQLQKAEYWKTYTKFLKGVQISEQPEEFEAKMLNGGEFLLGNSEGVSIKDNLDKNMQRSLYLPSKIVKWAVIVQGDEQNQAFKLFSENLIAAAKTYCVPLPAPNVRFLKTNNIQIWKNTMQNFENQNLAIVILILQGEKKQAPLYSDLKQLLITEKGIPSQVVLQKTLMGKGIRSICNKILVQMVAKTGGLPWIISNMPLKDVPTMVIGIDVYHRTFKGIRKSIFAFVATMDFRFAMYFSMVKIQEPGEEIGLFVEDCTKQAILKFKQLNRQFSPARIIVYRDGVSDGQRPAIKAIEIPAIRRASASLACDNIKLVFITVDKKANAKFYDSSMEQNIQNCKPGSLIDSPQICIQEEFYMISAKVNTGIAQPVHYFILEDDIIASKETEEEKRQHKSMLELFTFKLCHLYYNWTGSIKVPAPCIYAHKLSNLVGDKWGNALNFSVSQQLQDRCSLYYI